MNFKAYILLLTLLLLSACTPGSPPDPDAALLPIEPTPADSGAVTISFGAPEAERTIYAPLIAAFNAANPDIAVQFVALAAAASGGDDQALRQLASAADTAVLALTDAPADMLARAFRDLAPLIAADGTFDRADFYTRALPPPGTPTYLLPATLSIPALAYNKQLWDAQGLSSPAADWTWPDLRAAAEQLAQKRGDTVDIYGLLDNGYGDLAMIGEVATRTPTLLTTPPQDIDLNTPQMVGSIRNVATLAQTGGLYVQSQGEPQLDDLRALVRDQRVAMWPLGLFPPSETLPFPIGVAPFPQLSLPFSASGAGYVMSNGTQHPDQAWRWLAFLSAQAQPPTSGADFTLLMPARRSVAAQSGTWARFDADAAATLQAIIAQPVAPASGLPLAATMLRTPIAQVLDGESAGAATRQAQRAYTQLLAAAQAQPRRADNSPVTVATPLAPVENETTITFAVSGAPDVALQQLATAFHQEHPATTVALVGVPTTGALQMTGIATTSDCFLYPAAPATNEYALLYNLQPLIDADPAFPRQDYPALLVTPFQQAGQLYGLPYSVSFWSLAYNQTAFDALGLEHPNANWTLNQFVNAATQLTRADAGSNQYGFAIEDGWLSTTFVFLDQFGATATRGTGDAQEPNFTDPAVLQAARAYLDLLRTTSPYQHIKGYTHDGYTDDTQQLIHEGRVGMWLTGNGNADLRQQSSDLTFAVAPLPFGDKALTANTFTADGLYIAAQTPHAQACWDWLKYLSDNVAGYGGRFPARRALATSEAFRAQAPAGAADVYAAYSALLARADGGSSPNVFTDTQIDYFWFFQALDQALQGNDLAQELNKAQSLTTQFLACVRRGTPGPTCATQVDPRYNGWKNTAP